MKKIIIQKMFFAVYSILVIQCINTTTLLSAAAVLTKPLAQATPITAQPIKQIKKIQVPEMQDISSILKMQPDILLKMVISMKTANTILNEIQKIENSPTKLTFEQEKSFTQTKIVEFTKPIHQYFNLIKTFSSLIKPVMLDVFKNTNSFLLDFIDSSLGLDQYLATHITTADALKTTCRDYIAFASALTNSLSPEAQKAFKDFCATLPKK